MSVPSSEPEATSEADLVVCRAMLRGGSRSFYAASHFLPRRVRMPAIALYAFCRLADDAVDGEVARPDASIRLQQRLERIYAGKPLPIAADRAFADVVRRFAIPHALPCGLLEGLAWDAAGRRYETLSDLNTYAARVAGTVGAMMTLIMGRREPEVVAYACDLGVAMQLTNIARDVGEDARAGRLYLPLRWLRHRGIDPDAWMARPTFTPAISAVVADLLAAAGRLYERAETGISRLPLDCRPGIRAARLLYAEIGREIERAGLDSVSRRAVVDGRRKAWLAVRALAATATPRRRGFATPLAEIAFIMDAVNQAPRHLSGAREMFAWSGPRDRAIWLIDLFQRLGEIDRRAPAGRGRP